MNKFMIISLLIVLISCQSNIKNETVKPSEYLSGIKRELVKEWPKNRTINLIFHGHSVPCGYAKTPEVRTLESYPYLILKAVKKLYPNAVINVINTAIGGENSESGEKRFKSDVLIHKPDIIFIDYALNDISLGLDKSKKAWEGMIVAALDENIKVILLTPSPDQRINILDDNSELSKHSEQIKLLSKKYDVGIVDSYKIFKDVVLSGDSLVNYMSQVNHPNEKGHILITNGVLAYF